jgi:hypothetical protein
MTRIELHKMVQELRDFTSKMNRDDARQFEMLLKRDRDDEDLESSAVKKLEELYGTYVKRKSKNDAEQQWKKLTGGK